MIKYAEDMLRLVYDNLIDTDYPNLFKFSIQGDQSRYGLLSIYGEEVIQAKYSLDDVHIYHHNKHIIITVADVKSGYTEIFKVIDNGRSITLKLLAESRGKTTLVLLDECIVIRIEDNHVYYRIIDYKGNNKSEHKYKNIIVLRDHKELICSRAVRIKHNGKTMIGERFDILNARGKPKISDLVWSDALVEKYNVTKALFFKNEVCKMHSKLDDTGNISIYINDTLDDYATYAINIWRKRCNNDSLSWKQ